MSGALKSFAVAVVNSLRFRQPPEEPTVAPTGPVARMSAAELPSASDEEVTQPFKSRRSQRRTRRLTIAKWEQPTARTVPEHQLPAYLTPLPESLPAPSPDALAVRADALAGMPMDASEPPTMREPEVRRGNDVHTRRTRPYDVPSDLAFMTGLGR